MLFRSDTRKAINDLDLLVRDVRAQVGPGELAATVADVRSTARAATDATKEAKALLARVGGRVEDDLESTGRVLEELRKTVSSIEQLSREVKERPTLLLRDLERQRREVPDR